jgi:phosphatidylserine/phosphatidylglycerophosphate/cardiolipin synthase-like enzyme
LQKAYMLCFLILIFLCTSAHTDTHFYSTDLQATLIARIERARSRLWCACYRLTAKPVVTALCAAKKRSVDVQVILDGGMAHIPQHHQVVRQLKKAGIPVVWHRGSGIFHHKYAVIDDAVWTGSYNWTRAGASRHKECVVTLAAAGVTRAFVQHFACMKRRCVGVRCVVPPPPAGVFFLPDHRRVLLKSISADCAAAQKAITVVLYDLTNVDLLRALHAAGRRGVAVRVLVDQRVVATSERTAWILQLRNGAGATVRAYRHASSYMHCKVIVIDDVVWMGSMNWTRAGLYKNQENVVRIADARCAAAVRRFVQGLGA